MVFSHLFAAGKKTVTVDEHVGRRLRYFRELEGAATAVVAEKLKISTKQLSLAEQGRRRLSPSQLFAVARHFDISVADFFDRREGTI